MFRTRNMVRTVAVLFAAIFLVSFLTVETYQSHGYSWLRYPGFLESNAELAVAGDGCILTEQWGNAEYCPFPCRSFPVSDNTFLLHICRAPPSRG